MRFPVIHFDKNFKHLELMNDEGLFSTTNKLALRKGLLLNSKVVDSDGLLFEVIEVKKLSNVYPFWKFEFFNPMIKVALRTKQKEEMPVEIFKNKILKIFKNDRDFWDWDGELGELIPLIESSKTHKEIVLILKGRFKEDNNE